MGAPGGDELIDLVDQGADLGRHVLAQACDLAGGEAPHVGAHGVDLTESAPQQPPLDGEQDAGPEQGQPDPEIEKARELPRAAGSGPRRWRR